MLTNRRAASTSEPRYILPPQGAAALDEAAGGPMDYQAIRVDLDGETMRRLAELARENDGTVQEVVAAAACRLVGTPSPRQRTLKEWAALRASACRPHRATLAPGEAPPPCRICQERPVSHVGRCDRCYKYFRRYSRERPSNAQRAGR